MGLPQPALLNLAYQGGACLNGNATCITCPLGLNRHAKQVGARKEPMKMYRFVEIAEQSLPTIKDSCGGPTVRLPQFK